MEQMQVSMTGQQLSIAPFRVSIDQIQVSKSDEQLSFKKIQG
jgi:hypothetical protein